MLMVLPPGFGSGSCGMEQFLFPGPLTGASSLSFFTVEVKSGRWCSAGAGRGRRVGVWGLAWPAVQWGTSWDEHGFRSEKIHVRLWLVSPRKK